MNLYLIHAALAAAAFLAALSAFVPAARRVQASTAAGLLWVGLVTAAWSGWGRGAGIAAAGMSLLYGALSLPLAGPTARSLFGVDPGDVWSGPPVPSESLRAVSEALAVEGPGGGVGEALLELCLADPATRVVLVRHRAGRDALAERLAALLRLGAGRWAGEHYLAASALAHPRALEVLLAAGPGEMEDALARIAEHFEFGAPL